MSNSTELPDAVIGTAEPSSSRIMLVLLTVVAIGMFGLFSTIFGWDNIPVIGDIVPLMANLGGSGIWYYLLGFIIGIGAIVSTLAGEVISQYFSSLPLLGFQHFISRKELAQWPIQCANLGYSFSTRHQQVSLTFSMMKRAVGQRPG